MYSTYVFNFFLPPLQSTNQDTYWNEEQFPRKFGEGIAEGFWWAFVTMTTVGYGDISPVGVPGRLFAVVWILTGLVIIAIFTGVITTSLTVVALSSNVKLYGTSVSLNYFFDVMILPRDLMFFTRIFL